jgi:hypothetical protein
MSSGGGPVSEASGGEASANDAFRRLDGANIINEVSEAAA